MNIYPFPINGLIKYNFITEITLNKDFMIGELNAIKNNDNLNYSYWNIINGEITSENIELENAEEEILDLFESITDEDIDNRLGEYKGKKDLNKIVSLINYFKQIDIKELIYIIDGIISNNYFKKDLIIFDKKLNKNLRYILSEYKTVVEEIQSDIDLSEALMNTEENADIEKIKTIFISHFQDLELQINGFNEQKDNIIKHVYLAQQGNKESKDYIIGEVIYNEASKMAKKFAYKSNKSMDEKKQLYHDLLQEAILSSMTGLNKYNFKKNDNFIYYIRFWMKQGIHKGLETQYNEIKIPSYIIQLFSKIKNLANNGESMDSEIDEIVEALIKENNEKISKKISDLKKQIKNNKGRDAERLKEEVKLLEEMQNDKDYKSNLIKKVKNALDKINSNSVYSIGNILKNLEDNESGGMEANILIDENADLERHFKDNERSEEIKTLLEETLTKEEYTVIKHRFGLFGADVLLLETLGKKLEKSAERVRQVLKNAQEKLAIKKFDQVIGTLHRNKKLLQNNHVKTNVKSN